MMFFFGIMQFVFALCQCTCCLLPCYMTPAKDAEHDAKKQDKKNKKKEEKRQKEANASQQQMINGGQAPVVMATGMAP